MTYKFSTESWKTERTVSLENRLDCIAKSLAETRPAAGNRIETLVSKFSEVLSRDYGTKANCPVTDLAIIMAPLAKNRGFGLSRQGLYAKDPLLASYVDEFRGYKNSKKLGVLAKALRSHLGEELPEYLKKYQFEKYVDVTNY